MNNQKLQNFIDLVTFDQSLISIESAIVLSEKKLQKLQDELQKIQKRLDDKTHEKKELKKSFDLQELHVKDLQEQENNQAAAMDRVKNTKECDAASKQLDHIRADRNRHEKKLMQIWNTYQLVEKEVEQFGIDHDQKMIVAQEEITKELELLHALKQELAEKSKHRDAKVLALPEQWIVSYENMRGKVTNPVVPVSQDSCSACFYLVSSRDLQMLRQNGLLSCKDCYRFLYFDLEPIAESK